MLKAKALKSIKDTNGEIIGYTLQDETGQVMNIKSSNIIQVIKSGDIEISNLKVTANNTLEFQEDVDSIRMKQLVVELNTARKVYEQGKDEIMSNYEYDKLYDELQTLEDKLGYTLKDSPTQNVGYEVVSKLEKEKHSSPMLSLDKTKDRDSLVSWLNNKEGILSWKLDGLTVVLTYENGILQKGVTRGNGEIGEVVTSNVRQFKNVPERIEYKGKLVIRGEATISYSSFNKINSAITESSERYKNPRNLCSGSVRQLDSGITAKRDVKWYAFELTESPNDINDDYLKQLEWLKGQGFDVVDYKLVTSNNILDKIEEFAETVKGYDIPSDGLVLTYRDKKYGRSLGATSKFPRHSIAFKWQDETAETRLVDIEWQVGRTGVITPVAIFEPVDLEGSTVSRASLHNLSVLCDTLGQPYVGQKIRVYKANMIIPQVIWGEKLEE